MIGAIGEWMLRNACAEAAKWPSHVRVSVNLSPAQFGDAALPAVVVGALASAGLDPDRLELEIEENVFLADSGASQAMLERFGRSAFGSCSTISEPARPASPICATRRWTRSRSTKASWAAPPEAGSRNAALVRAIVVLAETLGMETTAEGAETLEELAMIRRLGCSQVQGYIVGKPMPAEEACKLASESAPPTEVAGFSRPPRHRLIRTGRLQWDGNALDVRLRNISPGGAMIECERPIPPETRVELDLAESGVLGAEVRWSQHGQVGLRFDSAFELRKLAQARRAEAAPSRWSRPIISIRSVSPQRAPARPCSPRRGARRDKERARSAL